VSESVHTDSLYLVARREWDERYGDLITRARNWRGIAVLSMAAVLMSIGGMIMLYNRAHLVPYVVAVDPSGRVVGQGVAVQGLNVDERMRRAALYDWVVALRSVSFDPVAERAAIDKTYALLARGTQALTYVGDYYSKNSPVKASQNGSVAVEVKSILAVSEQTFEVEWIENATDQNGQLKGSPRRFKGSFTVMVSPPQDEKVTQLHPLGIYVQKASWTEEM